MTLVRWQATVQNNAGDAVVNPSVTVRKASDNSLANIFDDAGSAKANPFIGTSEGFVSFRANPGEYIIQGASGAENAPDWRVTLGAGFNNGFVSRAALLAALSWQWPVGSVASDGSVQYEYIGTGSVIPDMPGWVPYGDATPNHWAQNTTPGTTDMLAAFNAGLTAGYTLNLLHGNYYVSDTINVRRNGQQIIGAQPFGGAEGRGSAIVGNPLSNNPIIVFASATPDTQTINHTGISNLTIVGGENTARDFAVKVLRPDSFRWSKVRMMGCYRGLNVQGGQFIDIDGFFSQSPGTAATVAGSSTFRLEPYQRADLSYVPAFTTRLSNFVFGGGPNSGVECTIDIVFSDGLVISDGYIGRAGKAMLKIGPSVSGNIAAMKVSNVYFDAAAGPVLAQHGVLIEGGAWAGTAQLDMNQCFVNAAGIGLKSATSAARLIRLSNCDFTFCGTGIDVTDAQFVEISNTRVQAATYGVKLSNLLGLTVTGLHGRTISGGPVLDLSGTVASKSIRGLMMVDVAAGVLSDTSTSSVFDSDMHGIVIPYTPSLTIGGVSTGITYTTQTGRAIRRGNTVLFTAQLTLSSRGGLTGQLRISAPVAVQSGVTPTALAFRVINGSATTDLENVYAVTQAGSGNLRMDRAVTGGTTIQMEDTDITDTTSFLISGEYFVA